MNSIDYSAARKSFLRIFILFLVLTALIAVVSVLSGEFGELQMKILGTCLTISTASIVSMACAAFIEKKEFRRLGLLGITLSVAAGSMAIIGIWPEIRSEVYWKTTFSLAVFAAALAHGFLLVLPDLDPRHGWVQATGCVSIAVLALQIVFAAWGEVNDEMYYRVLTVVAILVGLQTLVVPILLKVSQGNQGKRDRLVLQSVEDGIFEDSSGRRYRVSEVSTK